MQAVGAAEKVFQLLDRKAKMPLDEGDYSPQTIDGFVQFKNVSFAYPTRPDVPVLKNLSFEAPSGKVTALVGSSGSGKSSVVSLLTSLYRHLSGSIRIDGVEVQRMVIFFYKFLIVLFGKISPNKFPANFLSPTVPP